MNSDEKLIRNEKMITIEVNHTFRISDAMSLFCS